MCLRDDRALCDRQRMQSSADLYLTTDEAAELLGVHRATVCRWAGNGKLKPVRKMGGKSGDFLFDRDDVIQRKTREEIRKAAAS